MKHSKILVPSGLLKRRPELRFICLLLCRLQMSGIYKKRLDERRSELHRMDDDGCPHTEENDHGK